MQPDETPAEPGGCPPVAGRAEPPGGEPRGSGPDAGIAAGRVRWLAMPFAELPPLLLYQALALRSSVFVVEQHCVYQDLDGHDLDALIIVGRQDSAHAGSEIVATARLLAPGTRFADPSIGRVCTAAAHRGVGLGRALVVEAIRHARERHPGQPIRISAQAYLRAFYRQLGFEVDSEPYLEDGIAHLEMVRRWDTPAAI